MVPWFHGELHWSISTQVLGLKLPFLSLADVLWMAGSPFIIIGAYELLKIFKPVIERSLPVLDAFFTVALAALLITLLDVAAYVQAEP